MTKKNKQTNDELDVGGELLFGHLSFRRNITSKIRIQQMTTIFE